MAAFDAGAVVEALDYDLSAVGGPRGTVPEPTDKQVRDWTRAMQQQALDAQLDLDVEKASVREIAEVIMSRDAEALAAHALEAFAALCGGRKVVHRGADGEPQQVEWVGGSPTYAQLAALPFRVQRAFFGWLTGELTRPEAPAGGTKPSLEVVRSA